MISLGLYRAPLQGSNISSYVYTNPHCDAEIGPGDRVFVICNKEPDEKLCQSNTLHHSVTMKRTRVTDYAPSGLERASIFGAKELNAVDEEQTEEMELLEEMLVEPDGSPVAAGFVPKARKMSDKKASVGEGVATLRNEFNSLKDDIALLRTELKNIVQPPKATINAPEKEE